MNTNKLTMKDYIIIYFIILLIAAFLGGFFLGAKVMEKQLKDIQPVIQAEDQKYKQDEIIKFYDIVFAPVRNYNLEIQVSGMDDIQKQTLIEKGSFLKSNIEVFTFHSPYLKSAQLALIENLDLILASLNQTKSKSSEEKAIHAYLLSQREFYREIWVWEQNISKENKKIDIDSGLHLIAWDKANLHQKNYIVATIMEKNTIQSFVSPENVTVRIDTYLASDQENTIELKEIVNLLIKSNSILDGDFLKNKHLYSEISIPNISIFK